MNDLKKQILEIYEQQKKFGYLQEINLSRDDNSEGGCEWRLDIILSEYPFKEYSPKLLLKFGGVRNFALGNVENLYNLQISIIDIREYQLEGINYRIKEEEYEIFSFECKTVMCEII